MRMWRTSWRPRDPPLYLLQMHLYDKGRERHLIHDRGEVGCRGGHTELRGEAFGKDGGAGWHPVGRTITLWQGHINLEGCMRGCDQPPKALAVAQWS